MRQSRDRGQVLLVGAIAIAFVLLALVAVFNGVVYTETASSNAASHERAPAESTTHGLVDGVEHLVTSAWDEETESFDDGLEGEIDEYVEQYQRTTATSERVVVSAEATVIENDSAGRRHNDDRASSAGEYVNLTVRYDSSTVSTERTHRIFGFGDGS
ncbi:hypothetical protein HALLA_09350 [Halostagnicola larsenii XH-48]|uniref:Uncharacterized protein n=1 Tax=Halostagnicola larsenii XH-48 TaxID=797299 RepID=W0JQ34_9EURY|nr:hypothetical protein [Halostagnicola larsenii]AHG00821.1 hypothetical protein HALLA_09350 [Halostagnicola larsenii XH-48]